MTSQFFTKRTHMSMFLKYISSIILLRLSHPDALRLDTVHVGDILSCRSTACIGKCITVSAAGMCGVFFDLAISRKRHLPVIALCSVWKTLHFYDLRPSDQWSRTHVSETLLHGSVIPFTRNGLHIGGWLFSWLHCGKSSLIFFDHYFNTKEFPWDLPD